METVLGDLHNAFESVTCGTFHEGNFRVGQAVEFIDHGVDLPVERGALAGPVIPLHSIRRLRFGLLRHQHPFHKLHELFTAGRIVGAGNRESFHELLPKFVISISGTLQPGADLAKVEVSKSRIEQAQKEFVRGWQDEQLVVDQIATLIEGKAWLGCNNRIDNPRRLYISRHRPA